MGGALWELGMYAIQLALNLGWSVLFFGLRRPGWALVELIFLLAAILVTLAMFWRRDRLAGGLFVLYAAWVAFAVVLNSAIWWLN
jgi:benzodiazapine receptor